MDDQHVYQHADEIPPTFKSKVGRDAQGRAYWEVTVEGHTSASDMAMALSNAITAAQSEVRLLADADQARRAVYGGESNG